MLVKLRSDSEPEHIGVCLEVEKANDLPNIPAIYLTFSFGPFGLSGVGRANAQDYPDLQALQKPRLADIITEYLLDEADNSRASATTIASAIDRQRSQVADILARDPRFIRVTHEGRSVLYGVKLHALTRALHYGKRMGMGRKGCSVRPYTRGR